MLRRDFLRTASLGSCAALSGCALARIDPWSVYIRSDIIDSPEMEQKIVSRGRAAWTRDGAMRVLYLKGSAYDRGYQHGKLLRDEVQRNFRALYDKVLAKFHFQELFFEAFERARPFIPQQYFEEMHGLAHGSKLPLEIIHHLHILPEIGEWGGTKQIKNVVRKMMNGELATTCSNFCMDDSATSDGSFYTVRILDWGLHRISKLHEYPLLAVHKPDHGAAFVNIGWVGFIGAISGMNEYGITLGEMGYGNPPGETLRGEPMPFLLREVLEQAKNLADVRRLISSRPGTNSFVYLMSDGKSRQAELYVRDRNRFVIFKPGEPINDGKNRLPGIKDVVYGGHYHDRMTEQLTSKHGKITPELLMREVIPAMAMPSNFQNVIYDPVNLRFWVNNALNPEIRAAERPYTYFDLKQALTEF